MEDEILDSLGQLIRLSNRIRNNNPDLLRKFESDHIDSAMKVMSKYSEAPSKCIFQDRGVIGCPFMYCAYEPKCKQNKCTHEIK